VRRGKLPIRAGVALAKPLRAPVRTYEAGERPTSEVVQSSEKYRAIGGEMYARMNADKVKALRARRGMTRKDLADAAGISVATARNAERKVTVRASTVWKIARVFGLEARDIARPVRRPSERPRLYLVR
jgi:DNA-binding XRE family transcriptional regulator